MKVHFRRIDAKATIPTYAHKSDAGLDVYSIESIILEPGVPTQVRTGIASEFDAGYVALVWDKSGISMKLGVTVLGGVIDAGYRGEWIIGLINLTDTPQTIVAGSKIAQVLFQRVERADIDEAVELSSSARGTDGFGSTGN